MFSTMEICICHEALSKTWKQLYQILLCYYLFSIFWYWGTRLYFKLSVFMQLGQKFSQPPTEDIHYSKTRSMLNNLGLQNYEKNFKKGLLTDKTLPLLTDR